MKIKEWVPGSHILMEKNENYWNAEAVTADTIKFVLMEDMNAAYSAYKTGEVMFSRDVPTEEIPNLREDPEFHVAPILGTYYVSLNLEREYFQDPKVRQALSLALDRQYIADTIMQGTYAPATNFIGPGVSDAEAGSSFQETTIAEYGEFFHVDDFESDLAKAKELLADAGYPNGEGFPMIEYMTNDAGYNKALAEYLQSAWGELGINTDIKIIEWASFTPTRRNGDYDIARNGWVYDYDDPSNMLNLFESTNGNNDGRYNNPEYDALIASARETVDKAEHYSLLHEAEQLLLNDMGMIPIAITMISGFRSRSFREPGILHMATGILCMLPMATQDRRRKQRLQRRRLLQRRQNNIIIRHRQEKPSRRRYGVREVFFFGQKRFLQAAQASSPEI